MLIPYLVMMGMWGTSTLPLKTLSSVISKVNSATSAMKVILEVEDMKYLHY
jgi:hypothetical protein